MLTTELLLGDSLNSSLVAVVAVEPDVMKDWATSVGIEVVKLTLQDLLSCCFFYSSGLKPAWLEHFTFKGHSEINHMAPVLFISNHYVQHDKFISLNQEPALDF
jgi:hypothetical protein